MNKDELSIYRIAKQQKITPKWTREVHKRFNGCKNPIFKSCGRKLKEITQYERDIVTNKYKEFIVGATMIEEMLDEEGIHIGHNRIHRILLEAGLAKQEPKKKHRRRWIRYERKHSLSLVHADWFYFKGKNAIIFIDDASRFITGFGEFSNANTANSLLVFEQSLQHGTPLQIHTDHGTQFVSNEREGAKKGISIFTQKLKEYGVRHLKARIKHPQANGKAERAIQTMKRFWRAFGTLELAVKHYNYKRPHQSLTNGKLRTPYAAFLEKMRKGDK